VDPFPLVPPTVMTREEDLSTPKVRATAVTRAKPMSMVFGCTDSCRVSHSSRVRNSCSRARRPLQWPVLAPAQRFAALFDDGKYATIELPKPAADPLRFRDTKRYGDRLKEAHAKHNGADALIVAHGAIGGLPAVMACFDFSFMGGSMGVAVGEALVAAARRAVEREAVLIVVPASGGARMQDGVLSLMQMPRTILAADMVKEAGLPYIVVLTDPTTGGVSASFAFQADVIVAESKAMIGFAGRRVIEQTIRQKLPDQFQTAEFLLEKGAIDMVVDRHALKETLVRLLQYAAGGIKVNA